MPRMTHASRWPRVIVALALCVGAFWSACGLLQFHEVFFSPTVMASAGHTRAPSPTTDASAALHPTRQYDRLVVVLIDAMRADMVLGSEALYGNQHHAQNSQELSQHMQFTRRLLASGRAAAFVAHASVPTVTMPRLKALLSGKPPAFIDILKNFNSVALADENIIQLMRESGFRIVFYGDDTWLKLFPDAFQRSEGTSGFYTRDTVEVDTNVTRHLRDELDPTMQHAKSRDWDVLVLHYLGLDHVGHLRGPRSSLMQDKLHEMDDVVKLVYESVRHQDAARREAAGDDADLVKPTLIALCSDHGMSEIGNHGGATVEESSALMAFMRGDGRPLGSNAQVKTPERRMQVDLVPTIAALFGLPIPMYSTGVLLDQIVTRSLSMASRLELLKALYGNFLQLRTLARVKSPGTEAFSPRMIELDERLRMRFTVVEDVIPAEEDEDLLHSLRAACAELQVKVARSDGSEYNTMLIVAGVVTLLVSASLAFFYANTAMLLEGRDLSSLVARVVIGSFIMTIVSLSSTSSIENEHATVFLVATTFLIAILFEVAKSNYKKKECLSLAMPICASLLCVRLLRERSQVINFARLNNIPVDPALPGNEFASDDSLSVWSTGPLLKSVQLPQSAYFATIVCTIFVGSLRSSKGTQPDYALRGVGVIFVLGMLTSAWRCELIETDDSPDSINFAARCVYGAAFLLIALSMLCRGKIASTSCEMAVWLLTSAVQKPSNLPTLGILCVLLQFLSVTFRAHSASLSAPFTALFSVWMAYAAFFALGNSHLVTTIDISQSYHGLEGYSQELVGALTFINVFSGPLVVFARLTEWIQLPQDRPNSNSTPASLWILLSYQGFRMAFYTIVVFFMRFHLFIWSVFAPKMLYEVIFSIVVALITLIL